MAERRGWTLQLAITEMWASLAIMVIWLAVLFDAVWGPNMVFITATDNTTIPSAVGIALFAFLATSGIAKRAFGHDAEQDDNAALPPRG